MELRQLRYFAKTAETLNFSDAAKALNVAQSTLSQQIRQLEDELDVRLFERNTHFISLTEAGKEVLPAALQTLHDADMCTDRIRDLRRLRTGSLNIGVTYSFSPILTEALLDFMYKYPHIKLNICYKPMEELMSLLRKREVDFVLAFKPTAPLPDVESHILFQDSLAVIVGLNHPLAGKQEISLEELKRYELALPAKGLQSRNAFDSLVSSYEGFKIRIEMNEVNILLQMVCRTKLVSVLAEDSVYGKQDVRAVPLVIAGNEMNGCVHILKGTYHKYAMKEFIRLLGESLTVKQRRNSWI